MKPKRPIIPKYVWIVFDPKGQARDICLTSPSPYAVAWPYAADLPEPRGWVTPSDVIAAEKAGYSLRRVRLVQPRPRRKAK